MPRVGSTAGWLDALRVKVEEATDWVETRCCFMHGAVAQLFLTRYQIFSDEALGSGGYGKIYKSLDTESGAVSCNPVHRATCGGPTARRRWQVVAAKCVRLRRLSQQEEREIKQEALILKDLRHPNVLNVLGAGMRGPGCCLIVMKISISYLPYYTCHTYTTDCTE